MRALFAALLDMLYPWPMDCAVCGARLSGEGILCPDCRAKLDAASPDYLPAAGAFSASVAARPYAGPAGALVRALKYRGMAPLAKEMGEAICAALALHGIPAPDRLCFVPMHRARHRQALFNHSARIARAVGAQLGLRPEPLLRRVGRGRRQAGIASMAARTRNVKNAFRALGPLNGGRILLVDDVYTTGATALACAEALRGAGAAEVIVAVYARGGGNIL